MSMILGDKLLIVATDRISCFDVVLGCGIPEKGRVLTKISLFWFDYLKDIIENHLLSADVEKYPKELAPYRDLLKNRSMLVKKAVFFAAGVYRQRVSLRFRLERI